MNKANFKTIVSILILLGSASALADAEVKMTVQLNPAGNFVATSSSVLGSAVLAKDGSFSADRVSLPISTFKTGIELRDQHMTKKYFEVEKFPHAILERGMGRGGAFQGVLKVHGVSRPINGTYQMNGNSVSGKFKCKMSEFGIAKASYMGVGVEDTIDVEVTLPVQRR